MLDVTRPSRAQSSIPFDADRLDRLEKQVNMILAEIKEMKGEQHDEHPGK